MNMPTPERIATASAGIREAQIVCHGIAQSCGWWTNLKTGEDLRGKRNVPELLCLTHSEVSEGFDGAEPEASEADFIALSELVQDAFVMIAQRATVRRKLLDIHSAISRAMEGARKGLQDDKLPHRSALEVELADALIRILDAAGGMNLELGGAFAEKLAFNISRSDHKIANRAAEGGKKF